MLKGAAGMYLFDTDVISNVFKKRPSPLLLDRLSTVDAEHQYISVITVAEIVWGAQKSSRPSYHLRNLESLMEQVAVLDFDLSAAYWAGRIRAKLESAGRRLAWADIQIAAIAKANDLTLITGNTKHFARITQLRVENWLQEPADSP